MQIKEAFIVLLLAVCYCANQEADEGSSMSLEELRLKIKQYEENEISNEAAFQQLNDEVAQVDVAALQKHLNVAREQVRQQFEMSKNAELYRALLMEIEPKLCLPKRDIKGSINVMGLDGKFMELECDGDRIAGPGWTVVQRRTDTSLSFEQSSQAYVWGFGNGTGNFFIGLRRLHQLSSEQPHELYIRLESLRGETRYARYNKFKIEDGKRDYRLKSLGAYMGTAGNALEEALGKKFRTRIDGDTTIGGWWIGDNYEGRGSNLNSANSLWITWPESFKTVEMMIRPRLT